MLKKIIIIFMIFNLLISWIVVSSVQAQDAPVLSGTLVVSVSSPQGDALNGLKINYRQVNQDYWYGYSGPLPAGGWPEAPFGLSLDLRCIPWVEVEPRAGVFPHQAEEVALMPSGLPTQVVGNDCLLYFGADALDDLPSYLGKLSYEDLLMHTQSYLEHAVRYQTARGISLFVVKEPGYPTANIMKFTAGQWFRLVKLACQVIRQINPQAAIIIEVIPQYLPGRGYSPYTFLDALIRDGVVFDGIMLVFSPPLTAKFTSAGYPDIKWVETQADVFADLGRQLIIRFSGVTVIKDEVSRQAWLDDIYNVFSGIQTVVGIYWDEVDRYPVKLTPASWPASPTRATPSSESAETILKFIHTRTSQGQVVTDANGQAEINAFAGEYEIHVEGTGAMARAHIYRGEERRLELVLQEQETTQVNSWGGLPDQSEDKEADSVSTISNFGLVISVTLLLGLGLYIWYRRISKKNRTKPKERE